MSITSVIAHNIQTYSEAYHPHLTAIGALTVVGLTSVIGLQHLLRKKPSTPTPAPTKTHWVKCKPTILKTLSALPDIWTIFSSSTEIFEHFIVRIPTPLKTAIAALATLNIFLVPSAILKTANLMRHPFDRKISNKLLMIISTLGVTSVVTGIASLGFSELVKHGSAAYNLAEKVTAITLPWASAASRLKMPLLAKDIWRGISLSNEIGRALKIQRIPNPSSRNEYLSSHDSMKLALEVLKKHKLKHIRQGLKDTIPDLDKKINIISHKMGSWISWEWRAGVREAQGLINEVQTRNFAIIKMKELDLLAHTFALASSFFAFAHLLVNPALSILASLTWLYALKLEK